jgi:RimJ/RimL family protein N-acetyltransferase
MDDLAQKPTIDGERIVLRPISIDDAEDFLASMDPEGQRLTGTHRTFTIDVVRDWFATRGATTDRWDLSIVERASGRWVGELAILDWDADNRSCGFRIAVGPDDRNKGYGTEATRLVVDRLFTDLPVHRIQLEVYAFNPRAQHVYERMGFVREGTLRDSLRWEGEYHDTFVMGLLRPDWERGRERVASRP